MRPARKEFIKTKKTFERLRLYHRSSSCQDFSMVTVRQNLLVVRAKSPSSKVPLPLGWGEGLARHSELRHTFFLFPLRCAYHDFLAYCYPQSSIARYN